MQRSLEAHLVRDDWLRLDLLHADWLVEEGALVQRELLVEGRADLEGRWGGGTERGQHGRTGQAVSGSPRGVALEVREREGAGAQVRGGGLGWDAVQGGVGAHHV